MQQNKIIRLAIIGVVVVVCLVIFMAVTKKAPNINLVLSPSVATAKIDGKKQVKGGNLYVSPGNHSVTVSYTGFTSRTVNFTAGQKLTKVIVILPVSSLEGKQYYLDHPEEQQKLEGLVGGAFGQASQQRANETPLIKSLPYIERYFRIDYGPSKAHPDDESAIAIYITVYQSVGKQQALDWIQKQGVDPSSLEIIYVTQPSPSPDY